ncbi:acylphosphatase [Pseudodesulfovibrio senegalensis]|jgi:acylphosphatase|uniref:acylphosphatase n=1 Tax=Pseudodesulfovibrio senegalensis TaxID=1721087 RepID=A0A6N6N718_9BACT|nr:acylphosphatase [Pseudodesulfovibrio senegalensis]KAB1442897.1 acylphosphatase [Pseudodesulfovibrio senegalensis]
MKSLHCIVKGKVQGGNFQGWLHKEAEQLNITGWVRNVADGEAEILAQGDPTDLKTFDGIIRTKAPLPEVDEIRCDIVDHDKTFDKFEMRG